MKECKIIRINDGNPQTIENENFLFVEEYASASKVLSKYLSEGWEVHSVVPIVTPGSNDEHSIPFYMGGYTFYLERTVNE